ncbi:MAG: sigma-54 dependent transcriptional regulator [Thioalkalispiraceae bacterium]|jgi:DNA-binding NtrC family response regulator
MNKRAMLGQSAEFESCLRAGQMIAATDVTVLIQGESGTGKELMAQHLHQQSPRAQHAFITVNCAALPESLAESELFGHRKGAFTGASQDQQGRIQAAHGGTLFLDEIGELPINIQAKLLRFLETGECQAVGQTHADKVNVRVIAATHRDLYNEAQQGRFREDLFYRLNVVPVQLPALRERHGDIPHLLTSLTAQLADKHQLATPTFSKDALKQLTDYAWPGNIRELKNFCERMLILLPGQTISVDNLPVEMRQQRPTRSSVVQLPDDGVILDSVEAELINQALHKTRGNQSKAARLLGITRSALLYRMNKHAII